MNKLYLKALFVLLPLNIFAQQSIFNNQEASVGIVTNMSQYASTGTDAVVFNPAGVVFSEGTFGISIGGVAGFQKVLNRPYTIDENGDFQYDMEHTSTIRKIVPSLQTYYKLGKTALTFSYAEEGAGGLWKDQYGNVSRDALLINMFSTNTVLPQLQIAMQPFLADPQDQVAIYSKDFSSHYYNRCLRFGAAYQMTPHLSGYIGVKVNQIGCGSSCKGNLFIVRPSTKQRWLYLDYMNDVFGSLDDYTEESINAIDSLTNELETALLTEKDVRFWSFSPVIGFDLKYCNWNFGVKYEMSPSVIKDYDYLIFPHDFSAGASVSLLNKKLDISTGIDLKWGLGNVNHSIIQIKDTDHLLYNVVLGLDYHPSTTFSVSASASYGNQSVAVRGLRTCSEYLSNKTLKLSAGLSFEVYNNIKLNAGFQVTPSRLTINDNNILIGMADNHLESHCYYDFYPRYSMAVGLSYGF